MKLDPKMVIGNVADPAVTLAGDNELMLGAGLFGGGGGLVTTTGAVIVNELVFDAVPSGFVTPTLTVPGLPRVTAPANAVLPRNWVPIELPPKLIVAPLTKFVPVTERSIVVPAVPVDGDMPLTTGAVDISRNVALAVPPPGAGFTT
jgi:hypothetical protein